MWSNPLRRTSPVSDYAGIARVSATEAHIPMAIGEPVQTASDDPMGDVDVSVA